MALQKFSASVVFLTTGVGLTICNSISLRELAQPVEPKILVCAQQIAVIISLSVTHLVGLVVLKRPKYPTVRFLLTILCFGCYVVTSMLAQRTLSANLYVALRRTQLVFTMVLEYLVQRKQPSLITTVAAIFMLLGSFTIAGKGQSEGWGGGDSTGYVASFACNCFGALYLTAVNQIKEIDPINLTFQCALYLAPLSAIWVFKTSSSIHDETSPLIQTSVFMSVILAAAMNLSVVWNTRINSPFAQSVCSVLKDALVIITSMIFISPVTSTDLLGCTLIFYGVAMFTLQATLQTPLLLISFLLLSTLYATSHLTSRSIIKVFSNVESPQKGFLDKSHGLFHTYMHSDATLKDFDLRCLLIVNAFSVSQPPSSMLVVWLSGHIAHYIERFSSELVLSNASVAFKYLDYQELLRETPLEKHTYFGQLNGCCPAKMSLPTFSDIVRNLLLFKYGGTWLDADSWPVKDFTPLHSSYNHFITSHQLKSVTNNHVIHAARPRSAVTESLIHLMALCPYDRLEDAFARSRNQPSWTYNDGVWDAVYQHQNQTKNDEKLVLLDIGAFDPWWKRGTANQDIFVIHSRYPRQENRSGIVTPQLQLFIDFLGTPLKAPKGRFNATEQWY